MYIYTFIFESGMLNVQIFMSLTVMGEEAVFASGGCGKLSSVARAEQFM